jgi:hypothetical protein
MPPLTPELARLDRILHSPELMRLVYVVLRNACRAPSHSKMRRTSGVAVREALLLLVKSVEAYVAEREQNGRPADLGARKDSCMSMSSREDRQAPVARSASGGTDRIVRGSAFHLLQAGSRDDVDMYFDAEEMYEEGEEGEAQGSEVLLNQGRKTYFRHDAFMLHPWNCLCDTNGGTTSGSSNVMEMIKARQTGAQPLSPSPSASADQGDANVDSILAVLLEMKAQLPEADEYKCAGAIDVLLAWLAALDEGCKFVIRAHPSQARSNEGDESQKKMGAEEEERERRKKMAQERQRALLESMRMQQLEAAKHHHGLMHGDDEDDVDEDEDGQDAGDGLDLQEDTNDWQDPLEACEGENCALCGEEMYALKGLWQHLETSTRTWIEYSDKTNAEIEAAYTSGANAVEVVINGECYELDFRKMLHRGPIDEDGQMHAPRHVKVYLGAHKSIWLSECMCCDNLHCAGKSGAQVSSAHAQLVSHCLNRETYDWHFFP